MRKAYQCAERLAQHASEYRDWEKSIYETVNSQNLTPIDIALENQEEHILSFFMSLTPGEFFTQNPKIVHDLYDQKYYTIIKGIVSKMITSKSPNYVLSTKFLESNSSGQYPTDKTFKHFELTLLHKFRDCPDPEIKYHPMLNAVVTEKLRLYNLWYVSSFIFYVIFLVCLSYSFYRSSYLCPHQLLYLRGISGSYEIGRLFCEIYTLLYGLFFTLSEIFEFCIQWRQTYKEKHIKQQLKHRSHIEKWKFQDSKQNSDAGDIGCVHFLLNAFQNIRNLDRYSLYYFSNVVSFYDAFNIFDTWAVCSFILWIVFRGLRFPIQWCFASLAFIAFSLSLFKYTRIFPSLGSYVQSIFRIYKIDIPRYAVIVAILLLSFYGGIHLASRQGQISSESFVAPPEDSSCNETSQTFYWIPSQISGDAQRYDVALPIIAGFIFLLDGGPSEYQETLLERNALFLVIYFLFAFTIIIVMSNVLIAQLTQTYSNIIKTDTFHYKIDLVVTFELKSNASLFFGRRARSLVSFYKMVVPVHIWNSMREESPEKESDIKINEILTQVNKGADRLQADSLNMFHMEDSIEKMSMHLQKLADDVLTFKYAPVQRTKVPPPELPELTLVPSLQNASYEKRIGAIEKKLDLILLRMGSS